MPVGSVEIVEFSGRVRSEGDRPVTTYVLAIDGEFARSRYNGPLFQSLPAPWRERYVIATYDVEDTDSWRDFFASCARVLKRERPFGRNLSADRATTRPPTTQTAAETTRHLLNAASQFELLRNRPPSPVNRSSDAFVIWNSVRDIEGVDPSWAHLPHLVCAERLRNLAVPPPESVDSSTAHESDPLLDARIEEIFLRLLDEPIERPQSLRFEINGYLAQLRSLADENPEIDIEMATEIASNARQLLKFATSTECSTASDEALRLVQAAIRYFTVANDALDDELPRGFEDDALVVNRVAEQLGRSDLIIRRS